MSDLAARATGKWRAILPMLGIPPAALTGAHGPCPVCGGKDRFRFDDRDGSGSWICAQEGAGDGVALVMRKNGWEFREAARRIEEVIGQAPREEPERGPDPERERAAKNKLWKEARPLVHGDLVTRYLEGRGLVLGTLPGSLRFGTRVRYQDGLKGTPSWHPAMIAKVVDATGRPVTLHRTYLSNTGQKADVPKPKKLMSGRDGLKGTAPAIRLAEPKDGGLGVAEGIETALSAAAIHGVPCWAVVSSVMMEHWTPPAGVTEVWVFADNDANYTGLYAGSALAHRLARAGLKVNLTMPEKQGCDWNDVLRERA